MGKRWNDLRSSEDSDADFYIDFDGYRPAIQRSWLESVLIDRLDAFLVDKRGHVRIFGFHGFEARFDDMSLLNLTIRIDCELNCSDGLPPLYPFGFLLGEMWFYGINEFGRSSVVFHRTWFGMISCPICLRSLLWRLTQGRARKHEAEKDFWEDRDSHSVRKIPQILQLRCAPSRRAR